jgi:phospholipid/cholesterol/gamma-HCH transport system substrate-binding protein
MKHETKVGAFFVASIAIIGWLVFQSEKIDVTGRAPKRTFAASFQQAAGLPKQSKVRIAGVEVGRVLNIKLLDGRAHVIFTVDESVPVYSNAVASMANIGILGEKFIDLDPGRRETGLALDGSQLRANAGIGLDSLMESLGAIANDLRGVTHALNASIGGEDGRMKLDEIIDNIKVLTAEFRAMAQENHGAINRIMANIESISRDFRERLPVLAKQFEDLGTNLNAMLDENRPEIKGLTGDVRKLAQGFQETSEDLRGIMAKLNQGEGTLGKLLTDDTTINKLNTAVDNVNEMLTGLNKMDLRLDLAAAQWEARGNAKVGLGIELAPRRDYWYSLELASTPDGKVKDETHSISPTTGLPTATVRTVHTEQTFTIGAQFNKRLGENFVVHAGIVEGFGGAGAQFRAFQDRFRVSALAYDFNKREGKDNPKYRASASYEFWKGMYAEAGVQDIANTDTRTFFFGGGIRWKDEDLKKLIGLAGVAK